MVESWSGVAFVTLSVTSYQENPVRWLLFIVFFAWLYIELSIFIHITGVIGLLPALLLVILTSVIGVSLIRNKGFSNLLLLQQKIRDGENPAAEMIKSVSFIIAGILLLVPGFVTDALGLLLLLPVIQKHLLIKLMPYIRFRRSGAAQQEGRTFEGEYQREDDKSRLRGSGDKEG